MLDLVLFNFHDVILSLTMICLFLSVCIMLQPTKEKSHFNLFLFLFFFASACIPLDTLINYGAGVRPWMIENHPDGFFIFEFGAWIQAPLAYWMVRCLVEKEFKFDRFDYLLFLPLVLSVTHQLIGYHSLPTELKVSIQKSLNIFDESVSVFFIQCAREIFRCYIAWICLTMVKEYIDTLNFKLNPRAPVNYEWLAFFAAGFFFINILYFVVSLMLVFQVHYGLQLPIGGVGLTGNYLTFVFFMAVLIMYSRSNIRIADIKPVAKKVNKSHSKYVVNPAYVDSLEPLMQKEKIYTNPDLTLDLLAEKMGISPRTLSGVINGHYGCNFFEYVNNYRVQEAKRLLASQEFCKTSMLDIMYEVGFNSKATFNGFFKKSVGTTPSQYRKQCAGMSQASGSKH